MKTSKELMQKLNVIPKLRLGQKDEKGVVRSTGPHRVKIVEDAPARMKNQKGQIVNAIRYIFEENGERKQYDVPVNDESGNLHYLIQQLSEIQEGEEIILEMKRKGVKNYISIVRGGTDIEVGDDHDLEELNEEEENVHQ